MSTAAHTGTKYLRKIRSVHGSVTIEIDVYSVLVAFNVTCPARQHAIKKLLCCGQRDKGGQLQDLTEARDAISRAIDLQTIREADAAASEKESVQ